MKLKCSDGGIKLCVCGVLICEICVYLICVRLFSWIVLCVFISVYTDFRLITRICAVNMALILYYLVVLFGFSVYQYEVMHHI